MTTQNQPVPKVGMRKVQTAVAEDTHKVLRKRQNSIEDKTGKRPSLAAVMSTALDEWASVQP